LILVVEDNPTYREVMARQLSRMGYAVELFADGHQAFAAYGRRRYDLLLTDCEMPKMDGYQLTAAIRAAEQASGDGRHLPIVAITGNSVPGEIERCRAAGMDDCLPKPVLMPALRAQIQKWLPRASAALPPASLGQAADEGGNTILDLAVLKAILGDNEAAARDMLQGFPAPSAAIVGEIEQAIAAGSSAAVAAAAHKLKSSARAIGANRLAAICEKLEQAGKSNDREALGQAALLLTPSFEEVLARIRLPAGVSS